MDEAIVDTLSASGKAQTPLRYPFASARSSPGGVGGDLGAQADRHEPGRLAGAERAAGSEPEHAALDGERPAVRTLPAARAEPVPRRVGDDEEIALRADVDVRRDRIALDRREHRNGASAPALAGRLDDAGVDATLRGRHRRVPVPVG